MSGADGSSMGGAERGSSVLKPSFNAAMESVTRLACSKSVIVVMVTLFSCANDMKLLKMSRRMRGIFVDGSTLMNLRSHGVKVNTV